jgi:hypothetical protein
MKTITKSIIYLPMAAMMLTAVLAVPVVSRGDSSRPSGAMYPGCRILKQLMMDRALLCHSSLHCNYAISFILTECSGMP